MFQKAHTLGSSSFLSAIPPSNLHTPDFDGFLQVTAFHNRDRVDQINGRLDLTFIEKSPQVLFRKQRTLHDVADTGTRGSQDDTTMITTLKGVKRILLRQIRYPMEQIGECASTQLDYTINKIQTDSDVLGLEQRLKHGEKPRIVARIEFDEAMV